MSQQHFVGLEVSVKETAICIVDPQGRAVHRARARRAGQGGYPDAS